MRQVDECPAELLRTDVVFNLETYAIAKNNINANHEKLIEDCGKRDMLELYYLRHEFETMK